ncbi:MAG: hypothetical protein IJU61_06080 [Victivallales bacterium]|nr:hypothetical protein [Victivallales bacterium]
MSNMEANGTSAKWTNEEKKWLDDHVNGIMSDDTCHVYSVSYCYDVTKEGDDSFRCKVYDSNGSVEGEGCGKTIRDAIKQGMHAFIEEAEGIVDAHTSVKIDVEDFERDELMEDADDADEE